MKAQKTKIKTATEDVFPQAWDWFAELRDRLCGAFESLEQELESGPNAGMNAGTFERKSWERTNKDGAPGGGGEMSAMKGRVFEKVGVNISNVYGSFPEKFAKEIPGAADNDGFFRACGISVVAHMHSPHIPAVHMNTRIIETSVRWFGGGADLTPAFPDKQDTYDFHEALKNCCDRHKVASYPEYRAWCDRYFFLPHRGEPRGVSGIFYDDLNSGDDLADFAFTKDLGETFLFIYPELVRRHLNEEWTREERDALLIKRGRYVEFNLLYDRGTRFGLQTGGNPEAVLMSMPPEVKWG